MPGRNRYRSIAARLAVALLVGGVLLVRASAQEACAPTAASTELGEIFTFTSSKHRMSATKMTDRLGHFQSGGRLRYLRAIVQIAGGAPSEWQLTIRDSVHHVLQTIGAADFVHSDRRWTERLPFSEVFLELSGNGIPSDFAISVTDYFAIPDIVEPTFYSVSGPEPDWKPLYPRRDTNDESFPPELVRLGESVGIVLIPKMGKMRSCSGFAVAPDLFMTNWHCGPGDVSDELWANMCRRLLIDFSWDDDGISRDFECVGIREKDKDLDYALLQIAPVSASAALRPVRLSTKRLDGGTVSIIHHPLAEQKRLSRDCALGDNLKRKSWTGDREGTEFEHTCDTEGGSSGAAVFNGDGEVVGLHHAGFDWDRDTCKPLPNVPKVNKGVWMDAIIADLDNKGIKLARD